MQAGGGGLGVAHGAANPAKVLRFGERALIFKRGQRTPDVADSAVYDD
jgi:hypothetical protein